MAPVVTSVGDDNSIDPQSLATTSWPLWTFYLLLSGLLCSSCLLVIILCVCGGDDQENGDGNLKKDNLGPKKLKAKKKGAVSKLKTKGGDEEEEGDEPMGSTTTAMKTSQLKRGGKKTGAKWKMAYKKKPFSASKISLAQSAAVATEMETASAITPRPATSVLKSKQFTDKKKSSLPISKLVKRDDEMYRTLLNAKSNVFDIRQSRSPLVSVKKKRSCPKSRKTDNSYIELGPCTEKSEGVCAMDQELVRAVYAEARPAPDTYIELGPTERE